MSFFLEFKAFTLIMSFFLEFQFMALKPVPKPFF